MKKKKKKEFPYFLFLVSLPINLLRIDEDEMFICGKKREEQQQKIERKKRREPKIIVAIACNLLTIIS